MEDVSAANETIADVAPSTDASLEDVEDLALTDRQLNTYRALGTKSPDLAGWYLGAIVVLRDETNPVRYQQAAHALREIMKNIHTHGISGPKEGPRMHDRVSAIIRKWKFGPTDIGVGVTIDARLSKFLKSFADFKTQIENDNPSRLMRFRTFVIGLDSTRASRSESAIVGEITKWSLCYDFFNKIAHHSLRSAAGEFEDYQSYLEDFLVSGIAPRAFQNFNEIDALISEGEGRDQ